MTVKRQTLTVEQTARLLGTSPATVRKGVLEGKLPGTAVGAERELVYIIPQEAIERFLETGQVQERDGAPTVERAGTVEQKRQRDDEPDAAHDRPSAYIALTGMALPGVDDVTSQPIECMLIIHQDGSFSLRIGTETFPQVAKLTPALEALIYST